MISQKKSRIEKFLSTYGSEVTKRNYRVMLKVYFHTFYEDGELDDLCEKYFKDKRVYEDDVEEYFSTILPRSPKTVEVCLSMARTFLADNDIEFSASFWKKLRKRKKGHRALTQDKIPTAEELRRIITQLPLDGKALFLVAASSGIRIGETLKLLDSDIDLTKEPAIVRIRAAYTKSGNQRITFISGEAREVVIEWLKRRNEFLHQHQKTSDGRLFPLSYFNMIKQWDKALKKTGLAQKDATTNWNLFHIHVLRKFFRTMLATKIPLDIVECLMGHEGYLSGAYQRYSEAQLGEFYKNGASAVSIYGGGEPNEDLNEVVQENIRMRKEIAELQNMKVAWDKMQQDYGKMYTFVQKQMAREQAELIAESAETENDPYNDMMPVPKVS